LKTLPIIRPKWLNSPKCLEGNRSFTKKKNRLKNRRQFSRLGTTHTKNPGPGNKKQNFLANRGWGWESAKGGGVGETKMKKGPWAQKKKRAKEGEARKKNDLKNKKRKVGYGVHSFLKAHET